jgi:hypothetical protein
MINLKQAVLAARLRRPGHQPVEAWINSDHSLYVIAFKDSDPHRNLTVGVDAQTGEADTLATPEFLDIYPTLERLGP